MAWKAKINSVRKDAGNVVANVTLSRDDGDLEVITRDIQADDLSEQSLGVVLGRIVASRTKRDASEAQLQSKAGQDITIILPE